MTVKLTKVDEGYRTADHRFLVQYRSKVVGGIKVTRYSVIDQHEQFPFVESKSDTGSNTKIFDTLRDLRLSLTEIYEHGREVWA